MHRKESDRLAKKRKHLCETDHEALCRRETNSERNDYLKLRTNHFETDEIAELRKETNTVNNVNDNNY